MACILGIILFPFQTVMLEVTEVEIVCPKVKFKNSLKVFYFDFFFSFFFHFDFCLFQSVSPQGLWQLQNVGVINCFNILT